MKLYEAHAPEVLTQHLTTIWLIDNNNSSVAAVKVSEMNWYDTVAVHHFEPRHCHALHWIAHNANTRMDGPVAYIMKFNTIPRNQH
jgi:L-ascorbate metabolism protein UlaG (beta-lactamase superfamily)